MKPTKKPIKFLTAKIVRIACFAAFAFVLQIVIAALPNVELVSVFFLVISLVYSEDAVYVATVFTFLQGIIYGFGIWWIAYLYIWPIYCAGVIFLRKKIDRNWLFWAIYAAFFGLSFGALTAIPYIIIDRAYVLLYWISGIPFDIVHCLSNFVTVILLAKPLYNLLSRIKKE